MAEESRGVFAPPVPLQPPNWRGTRPMTLTYVVLVFALLLAAGIVCNAALLRLSGWMWRIPAITNRRTLIAALLTAVLSMGAGLGTALAVARVSSRTPSGELIGSGLSLLLLMLGAAVLYRLVFRLNVRQAIVVTCCTIPPGLVAQWVLGMSTKALLLEAYVVPHGAMAPTILGLHINIECDDCGWKYSAGQSPSTDFPGAAPDVTCPNCGFAQKRPSVEQAVGGDRILVDKSTNAQRWDLVVFPVPAASTSYIKRLVGLPGEEIVIRDGDLFADGIRLSKPLGVAEDLWFPVHDTRYRPTGSDQGRPHWQAEGAGWRECSSGWEFQGGSNADGKLIFAGPMTDQAAYNQPQTEWDQEPMPLPVSDVLVTCVLGELKGPVVIRFNWQYRRHQLSAGLGERNRASIRQILSESDEQTQQTQNPAAAEHEHQPLTSGDLVEFGVRDGDAFLKHNGRVVARLTVLPDELQKVSASEEEAGEPCRLTLAADSRRMVISSLRVSRDIYYRDIQEMDIGDIEGVIDRIQLGNDEYFLLGDNSPRSKDSRFFGPVPSRTTVGVARWIYWPPSRWHEFR
jgi:signal peptidase I